MKKIFYWFILKDVLGIIISPILNSHDVWNNFAESWMGIPEAQKENNSYD